MYPHPHHFHHMGWHRGPSRIVWFLIGAASASFWIKRRDADQRIWGHCKRPALPAPTPPAVDEQKTFGWPQSVTQAVNYTPPAAPSPPTSPSPPGYPLPTPGSWVQDPAWKWDAEREHLAKISRQAADAMTELTESTLESVLTTAESLKVKLAEHRAQREQQQKIIDKQLEEQRKNPPRLV